MQNSDSLQYNAPEAAAANPYARGPILSRRNFMQGAVAVALTLTACGPKERKAASVNPEMTPEERLLADIREHLNAPGNVDWKAKTEIRPKDHFKCADGREKEGAGGTFGGGTGRFLEDITALSQHLGRSLKVSEIDALLDDVIDDGLYLHTDKHANERLAQKLGVTDEQLRERMQKPEHRDEIINGLFDPADGCACVGCAHLRFMAANTKDFPGLEPELVRHILRKVEIRRLDGDEQIREEELEGEHEEIALLDIDGPDEAAKIPLIRHADGKRQVFVINRAMERMMDKAFLGRIKKLQTAGKLADVRVDEEKLLVEMAKVGNDYTGITTAKLEKKTGKKFPVVNARYSKIETFESITLAA